MPPLEPPGSFEPESLNALHWSDFGDWSLVFLRLSVSEKSHPPKRRLLEVALAAPAEDSDLACNFVALCFVPTADAPLPQPPCRLGCFKSLQI